MLEELLLTVLAGFLLSGFLLLLAAWRAVRWVRRSGRLRQRVRTAQALVAPPGPRREVAWLRRELAAATRASTEAVALVRNAGGVVGELPGLARRLGRVAGTLDAELRLLAGEPDPAEIAPLQAEVEREVAALDAGIDRLLALAAGP
jgi:hypothetical protein